MKLQATSASYKPSPLGYGSPRSSPFRRPESPASPSPLRQTTPLATPSKAGHASIGSRFADSSTTTPTMETRIPRGDEPGSAKQPFTQQNASPVTARRAAANGNALSQLQPTQVRTLREGFQILDRDGDGVVNRDDVADMLTQLGTNWPASTLVAYTELTFHRCRSSFRPIRRITVLSAFGSPNNDASSISQLGIDVAGCSFT